MIATLALIGIMIPQKTTGDVSKAKSIQTTPLDVLSGQSTTGQIKEAVVYVSRQYGGNFNELFETIKCESSFKHDGNFGDHGAAYGIAQFHKPTFERYCQGDYFSIKDQLICMAQMFNKGMQANWTCWKHLYN